MDRVDVYFSWYKNAFRQQKKRPTSFHPKKTQKNCPRSSLIMAFDTIITLHLWCGETTSVTQSANFYYLLH